jgi:iron(III) transport system ATP-binding protein
MSLSVQDLHLRFAKAPAQVALAGVSLSLPKGDIGVLLGPSGCGKTTLLRAVAGLERACQGRITLGDVTLVDAAGPLHLPPERRRIGMVFQDFALFPHLSVAQNIAFGLATLPRARKRERVQAMLELVGLSNLSERWPHQLSGGQQQRVALARALAPSPDLLLLDEPFSSLDVDLRERLAHELRVILKAAGSTALFVTHDQLEAFALGDHVGVMQQGHLHQWASPYELYHRPASHFVAEFIGHGTFVPVRVVADRPGHAVIESPLGPLRPPGDLPPPWGLGEGELLLRADDVVHDDASPVQATIVRKAFRGAEFLYTLKLDGGLTVMSLVPSHHDHGVGERIGIRLEMDHIVTFARQADTAAAF